MFWRIGLLYLITSVVGHNLNDNSYLVQNTFSYELCDGVKTYFDIKNVELIPSAPVKGQNLTVTVTGELEKDVYPGVKLKSLFKFRNIPLLRQTFDVCKELDNTEDAPMKCPIVLAFQMVCHLVIIK